MNKQQYIEKLRETANSTMSRAAHNYLIMVADELEAMDVVWVPREIDVRFRGAMQNALDTVAANPDAQDAHGNRLIWTDAVYRAVIRKAENIDD